MISVLLMILKILGLIILWTLIIVLALLLFILISPIRYRGRADVHGKVLVQAKVSWLLHILSISFDWKDKNSNLVIRIFGIPMKSKKKADEAGTPEEEKTGEEASDAEKPDSGKDKKKKKKKDTDSQDKKDKTKDKKEKPQKKEDKPQKKDEEKTGFRKTEEKPYAEKAETALSSGKAETAGNVNSEALSGTKEEASGKSDETAETTNNAAGSDGDAAETGRETAENHPAAEETGEDQPEDFLQKLSKIAHKIKNALSKAVHTFDPESPLMRKLDFITNLRTKHAVGLTLRFVGWLLKHILPRRGSGYIRYGFEDPSLTGRVLAAVAATVPLHKNEIAVQPDFTEAVFECDAVLKGKIVLGLILVKAVALILKKDVLFVIRNYKQYF
ncbi:MAG: DUF2953 domain-containing protein [Lachnospiraceae bacterium]|nr:DUF2953 domain-containing protein [Lachnospiraceae bacterium]